MHFEIIVGPVGCYFSVVAWFDHCYTVRRTCYVIYESLSCFLVPRAVFGCFEFLYF